MNNTSNKTDSEWFKIRMELDGYPILEGDEEEFCERVAILMHDAGKSENKARESAFEMMFYGQ